MCLFAFLPVGLLKTLEVSPVFIFISVLSFLVSSSLPSRKSSHCVVALGLTLSGQGVLGSDMLLKYFHANFLESSPQRVDWDCFTMLCCEGSYPAPSQPGWLSERGRLVDELASVYKALCGYQSRQSWSPNPGIGVHLFTGLGRMVTKMSRILSLRIGKSTICSAP